MSLHLLIKEIDLNIKNADIIRENFRRIKQYLEDINAEAIREIDLQGDGNLTNDHTQLENIGNLSHIQLDSHVSNQANPHNVSAAQVGSPSAFNKTDRFDTTVDGQTVFTLSATPSNPATAQVLFNSFELDYNTHYTLVGQTLTLIPAAIGYETELVNSEGYADRISVHYVE